MASRIDIIGQNGNDGEHYMKIEIDLGEVQGWDGESLASTIADELHTQIKAKVRKELKSDRRVDTLVKHLKDAAVTKLLKSFEEE